MSNPTLTAIRDIITTIKLPSAKDEPAPTSNRTSREARIRSYSICLELFCDELSTTPRFGGMVFHLITICDCRPFWGSAKVTKLSQL